MNAIAKPEVREANNRTQACERACLIPRVNITETKDAYLLEAEMPRVNKNGLEVLLEGNELTLVGRRQSQDLEAQLVYRESSPTDFRRFFVLDPTIDTGKIKAEMENGVLTLNLPKAEKARPRKITISS